MRPRGPLRSSRQPGSNARGRSTGDRGRQAPVPGGDTHRVVAATRGAPLPVAPQAPRRLLQAAGRHQAGGAIRRHSLRRAGANGAEWHRRPGVGPQPARAAEGPAARQGEARRGSPPRRGECPPQGPGLDDPGPLCSARARSSQVADSNAEDRAAALGQPLQSGLLSGLLMAGEAAAQYAIVLSCWSCPDSSKGFKVVLSSRGPGPGALRWY